MKKRSMLIVLAVALVLSAIPVTAFADNPLLPLWERIPDGEPRVFTDPDTGEDRVYLYGSHDTINPDGFGYCGQDHVVWSAPVDDLTDWRHEGVAFEMSQLEGLPYYDESTEQMASLVLDWEKHVLYAPDVVYNPTTGKYYMYTFIAAGKPSSVMFVASSDRPAGPFTDPRFVTLGFDPAVLVDDALDADGRPRVYLYYSREANRDLFACELDPTDMCTILDGSLHYPDTFAEEQPALSTMISKNLKPFHFFEGPSIRKVNGWYILSYARSEPFKKNGNGKLAEIGWCYSDNPFGDPALGEAWTYGGVIVSNKGGVVANPYYAEEQAEADEYNAHRGEKDKERTVDAEFYSYVGNNNHGGMVEVNGQWYQVYHRDTNLNSKRQAMIEPISFTFDDAGRPVIEEAEMTSQGIDSDGMDPFIPHYAQSACYTTPHTMTNWVSNAAQMVSNPDGNFDPDADHGDWFPVVNLKNKGWLGYKYFNFGEAAAENIKLNLELTESAPAMVNIYSAEPKVHAQDAEPERSLIGTLELSGDIVDVHTVEASVDAAALIGRKAIFLEFLSDAVDGDGYPVEVCQINRILFSKGE